MQSIRKGIIGEHKVTIDLLEKGWDVYAPIVDDGGGIDLISIYCDCAWTIQVKYQHHKRNAGKTSWDIRVKPTKADYIAIPIIAEDDEHILYYPHFGKSTKNKGIIEAVYLFGGSIPSDALSVKNASYAQKIVSTKIRNYYSPHDEVLHVADYWNWVDTPIGYKGAHGKTISKYSQTMVKPKNHRFASYAAVLRSFP